MGKLQTSTFGVFIPGNIANGVTWRYNSDCDEHNRVVKSSSLAFDIFGPKTFVVTLSTFYSTKSVPSIAFHANFPTKHSRFCFWEPCHDRPTNFPYLITTKPLNEVFSEPSLH
jgi:hypothetical protein